MRVWRNPELGRHVRADLRPARIASLSALVYFIIFLVGLGCWSSLGQDKYFRLQGFGDTYFTFLAISQSIVICVAALFSCMQNIARERELKTLDFLRTTRLTAGEITIGKLLGTPVIGYFIFALCTPVTVVAGLIGGHSLGQILLTLFLVVVFALFLGMAGLWISSLMERQHTGAVIALIIIFLWVGSGFTTVAMDAARQPSLLTGFAGISILPAIYQLYGVQRVALPTVFGQTMSWIPVSLFLYVSLGAWLALSVVRNVKREVTELRPLSRWQALGFILYVNVLFYGFLNVSALTLERRGEAVAAALAMNLVVLYGIGLATLSPKERLTVWSRQARTAVLHEDAPGWPWLVAGWIIGMFCLTAYVASGNLSTPDLKPFNIYLAMVSILIFAVRDIMFLQWCQLKRFRSPLRSGVLLLLVYYGGAAVISAFAGVFSEGASRWAISLLLPFAALASPLSPVAQVVFGTAVQLAIAGAVTYSILQRLTQANRLVTVQAA